MTCGHIIRHYTLLKLWGIRSRTEKSWSIWCPDTDWVNGLVIGQFLIFMRRSRRSINDSVWDVTEWHSVLPAIGCFFHGSQLISNNPASPGVLLLVTWPAVSWFNWFPLLLSVFFSHMTDDDEALAVFKILFTEREARKGHRLGMKPSCFLQTLTLTSSSF